MSDVQIDGVADYLSGLNEAQREAVVYGADGGQVGGPLLVIAGAGSGKTNTLAHRVAHLLAMGADQTMARSSLRFSLGDASTDHDVAAVIAALPGAVARARRAGSLASQAG